MDRLALLGSEETPEVTRAQQDYKRFNREIALMLDVSGSMSGTKLSDMKIAAKDLVGIVMQNNGASEYKARVALVPFSGDVRPPSSLARHHHQPRLAGDAHQDDSQQRGRITTYTYYKSVCVGERAGAGSLYQRPRCDRRLYHGCLRGR